MFRCITLISSPRYDSRFDFYELLQTIWNSCFSYPLISSPNHLGCFNSNLIFQ